MRVVNDKEKPTESADFGFLGMLGHACLISVGMSTLLFSPLPMIVAHLRLSDPWPKLACLLGALLALVGIFGASLPVVVLSFVFGLFIADNVFRETSFFKTLFGAMAVALFSAALLIFTAAKWSQLAVEPFLRELVAGWAEFLQTQLFKESPGVSLELKSILWNQGPFIYLTGALMSFWLSIGMCAHFQWLPTAHRFGAAGLRKLRFSKLYTVAFVALGGLVLSKRFDSEIVEGAIRTLGTFLVIPGSLWLSELFSKRKLRRGARTVLYAFALTFGFYVVVGLGAVRPWFSPRSTKTNQEAL